MCWQQWFFVTTDIAQWTGTYIWTVSDLNGGPHVSFIFGPGLISAKPTSRHWFQVHYKSLNIFSACLSQTMDCRTAVNAISFCQMLTLQCVLWPHFFSKHKKWLQSAPAEAISCVYWTRKDCLPCTFRTSHQICYLTRFAVSSFKSHFLLRHRRCLGLTGDNGLSFVSSIHATSRFCFARINSSIQEVLTINSLNASTIITRITLQFSFSFVTKRN